MLSSKSLIAIFLATAGALAVPERMSLTLIDVDGGDHVVSWPFFNDYTEYFHFGKNTKEVRGVAEGWPGQCSFYTGGGTSSVVVATIGPLHSNLEVVVPIPQDRSQAVFWMWCKARVVG